jgi:hypothetical protein
LIGSSMLYCLFYQLLRREGGALYA